MEKEIVLSDFNQSFDALIAQVTLYDHQNFNEVPFEGSWTPAQVVQHLVLANGGFAEVLKGNVRPTERAIDEQLASLKSIFLDFGTKLKSPDFIKPVLKDYDKNEFLSKIKKIQSDIATAIQDLDLSQTCLAFELPNMGFLTRLEAVYFVVYHTQRHTHQLDEIYQFLKIA